MIVLGIDPGTARLGLGFVEFTPGHNIKLLRSEVIITPPEMEQYKRLKMLYKNLSVLIKEYSPKIMVVERLFFNTNVKTAITVGQARGVIMLAAADKKMGLFEYTALEAKVALTGYGRSDKKQMQEAVREYLGLDTIIKSDDANDAVAMAICHIRKHLQVEK